MTLSSPRPYHLAAVDQPAGRTSTENQMSQQFTPQTGEPRDPPMPHLPRTGDINMEITKPSASPAADVKGSAVITKAKPTDETNAAGPTQAKSSGIKRTSFRQPANLPEEGATILDASQILHLAYCAPLIRKRYPAYFDPMKGHMRSSSYYLLFEKDPEGNLKHPENIIASNIIKWPEKLVHYEKHGKSRKERRKRTPDNTVPEKPEQVAKKPKMPPLDRKGGLTEYLNKAAAPQATSTDAGTNTAEDTPIPNVVHENDSLSVPPSIPPFHGPFVEDDTGSHVVPDTPEHPGTNKIPTFHSHPIVQSGGYEDFRPMDTIPSQNSICGESRRPVPYGSLNTTGDTTVGTSFNQIDFLRPDSLMAYVQWIEVHVHGLNQSLIAANAMGRSHAHQRAITNMVNTLLQNRMACLEMESTLRVEEAMQ